MATSMKQLCEAPAGQAEILQGNIAFAAGCVRGGIHAADGYPGTPSSEVIDRGLSQVQDMIKVGWSVNEAVASAVGHGHTIAGRDCVVTMKIPGLFQAGDIFTSGALFVQERGALIYYIASDFTPSSTQHTIDPRYLFKSCFIHWEIGKETKPESNSRFPSPNLPIPQTNRFHSSSVRILRRA